MAEPGYIRPRKSLGQNFLKDPHYLKKIVDTAQVGQNDQVLEIGPGLGHLTRLLAERAGKILALELDHRLIPHLRQEFSLDRHVEIRAEDALEFSYGALPGTWKVVANLPYYISTAIIQKLLAHRHSFTSLTLMLQKEVSDRIVSPPGGKEYGFLSVLVQLYTEPRIAFSVPAGAFTPKPKVDSAVISLMIREHIAVSGPSEDFFMRVLKAAFSQRRKTLRNALKQLDVSGVKMDAVLRETGIDLGRRAETLTVEEFVRLSSFLRS